MDRQQSGRQQRSGFAIGLVLVLVGLWYLALQLVPGLQTWVDRYIAWPLIIIGIGVLLFFIGLISGAPGMAVPAAVVSGIGAILWWQNQTGNWESWSYMWALIPGFVGVGVLLAGALGENRRRSLREGISLMVISAILFAIFAAFLGGSTSLWKFWPVLLVLLGVWLLVRPMLRGRD